MCLICAVRFDSNAELVKHSGSDLHEVSLSRKVDNSESLEIAPVTRKEGISKSKKQGKRKKTRVKECKGPRQYKDYSFVRSCLFCNLLSVSLQDNLRHM